MKRALRVACALVALAALAFAGLLFAYWEPDRPVEALKARWAPPPSTFLDVAGLSVHLRDEGPRDDATPVVLLHGTSASLHTWDGWATTLSKERRVIRFDLPGFGLTGPAADGDYTITAYVRFVIAVLDALGVRRFVLAGNSLGGEIAWATAAAHPGRVAGLVLVDAAGYPLVSQSVPIGFRLAQLPGVNRVLLKTLPRRVVAASVRNVYGDPSKVTDALVDRYFELTLREGNRASLPQRFKQAVHGAHAADVRRVTAPTLILWGDEDRLIPPEHADWFHRDLASSTLQRFKGLGHVPQEEDPTTTLAAVQAFVRLLPSASVEAADSGVAAPPQ
ncbi:MAG: alpha/beta hydrolase [Myxococcales bacterium]|nr:alpha/beta hydrolase [Myxococcales bacterium]